MNFNPFKSREKTSPPVRQEKEAPSPESEFQVGLKRLIEQLGGKLTVDGIEVAGETIFAFYVSLDSIGEVERFLADSGYKSEENIDDPYNFPESGKYRKIFMPAQKYVADSKEEYFFRVAEKSDI